jgi:alpha-N-arabinofuranosidase
VTLNPNWGGVVEPNTFGTHEFLDFLDQIGAEAYLSVNVGSGTPQEAAEWLEYLTAAQPTTLVKERAANGRSAPYKIAYLGIGNESWDCGGNMSPDYYVSQLRIYSRFVRNFNPEQQDSKQRMLKIAVGPGGGEARWTEWTEAVMKAYQNRQWSWDMDGLSLHTYTVVNWEKKHASVGFGEAEYAQILKKTLEMEGLISKHSAIMDKYDPQKRIALVVDEWGAWYAPLPGSNPGFLAQQNSQRDAVLAALNLNLFARHADRVRMTNIAQMINVLQAMILTDREKMVLTPTYHVFKMYVPFQDATFVPVTFDAGTYTHGDITLPRVDAIAARDAAGRLWLALTNVDPNRPAEVEASLPGVAATSVSGETLTAPKVDSVNTFEAPNTVVPKPVSAKVEGGKLTLKLEPKSVTVISIGR